MTGVLAQRIDKECDELDRMAAFLSDGLLAGVLAADRRTSLHAQLVDCRRAVRQAADLRGEPAWRRLGDAATEARRLRGEIFFLVQGELFRSAGMDNGVSAAAGRLLEHVRRRCAVYRGALTTFSPDVEEVDHTIGLIRLQFPGTTVWDLPFCVHEFGHHAVREIGHVQPTQPTERPLLDVVAGPAGVGAGLPAAHAHELIADLFATYALGGAYPLACLVQRVDPPEIGYDTATHPSWGRRLATMVAGLRHLTTVSGQAGYQAAAEQVVLPAWGQLTGGTQAAAPDAARLAAFARTAVDALHRHAGPLRYDGADQAVQVRSTLAAGPAAGAAPPPDASATALVDGAWRWRQQDPARFTRDRAAVGELVLRWCAEAPFPPAATS